jgi:hypothetical protein
LTGGKDLLEVAVRTPEGTFAESTLQRTLNVRTLDERTDLPIYGQWDRLRRRALTGGWEEWRLYLRDFKDVAKARFRSFINTAAGAYFRQLAVSEADPKQSRPWMVDGRQWHLSQRSISKRHVIRWSPAALLALIGRFKSLQPDMEIAWGGKTAMQLLVPGEKRYAAKIVTNIGRGMRVELRAPNSALTPTQIDRLGEDVEIKPHDEYDRIVFWLRSLGQNDSRQLSDVWRRCRGAGVEEELQLT